MVIVGVHDRSAAPDVWPDVDAPGVREEQPGMCLVPIRGECCKTDEIAGGCRNGQRLPQTGGKSRHFCRRAVALPHRPPGTAKGQYAKTATIRKVQRCITT